MNHATTIDRRILDQLSSELGRQDTAEVLRTFLSDTARKIILITAEGVSGSAVKRESHSIKSSAATFGFERLSALACELELGAERMNAEHMAASIQVLKQAFEETRHLASRELLAGIEEISS